MYVLGTFFTVALHHDPVTIIVFLYCLGEASTKANAKKKGFAIRSETNPRGCGSVFLNISQNEII